MPRGDLGLDGERELAQVPALAPLTDELAEGTAIACLPRDGSGPFHAGESTPGSSDGDITSEVAGRVDRVAAYTRLMYSSRHGPRRTGGDPHARRDRRSRAGVARKAEVPARASGHPAAADAGRWREPAHASDADQRVLALVRILPDVLRRQGQACLAHARGDRAGVHAGASPRRGGWAVPDVRSSRARRTRHGPHAGRRRGPPAPRALRGV